MFLKYFGHNRRIIKNEYYMHFKAWYIVPFFQIIQYLLPLRKKSWMVESVAEV